MALIHQGSSSALSVLSLDSQIHSSIPNLELKLCYCFEYLGQSVTIPEMNQLPISFKFP